MNLLTEKLQELGVTSEDLKLIESSINSRIDEAAEKRANELLEAERAAFESGVTNIVESFTEKFEAYKDSLNEAVDAKLKDLVEAEKVEFMAEAGRIQEAVANAMDHMAKELVESVEAKYRDDFESQARNIVESFENKLEQYSSEVLAEAVAKAPTQSDLKVAMAEELMEAIRNVYGSYNVNLPEGVDFVADFESHITENEKLSKEVKTLKSKLNEKSKEAIVNQLSEGMTIMQKENFASLVESVVYVSDELYTKRLSEMKTSFLSANSTQTDTKTEVQPQTLVTESVKVDASKYKFKRQ